MKSYRYIFFLFMLLALIFTPACEDELLYDNTVIGEGEANLNVRVEFHSLESALGSRSAGNAADRVDQLWVVIYKVNADGSEAGLYEKIRLYDRVEGYSLPGSNFNIDQTGNSADPVDAETVNPSGNQNVGAADGTIGASGQKTPSATFSLSHIPFGRYKMFAVANVDLTDVDCTTIDDLRGKRFDWQTNVSLDNQMFGYFTMSSPASAETATGFDAPMLVINQGVVSLHSWIKRLVSKVTVAIDGSDLKENVRVYIKSITIHDIPKSCALGEVNSPKAGDLITNGESFTYYGDGEESDANHENWNFVVSKGNALGGQYNHTETDPSLYFYENMQGDYPGIASMDKRQDPDAVGTPIDKPEDGPDYKDHQLYGTYIEVVGYYDSRHKDKVSQGPIRYRFMLGKNSTYNYNAERNYHYKLTLKLRGWANEADWHISYKEYSPTLITPEPYYISYLYDQKMDFPARVILPEEWDASQYYVKAEIVENNWFPWDRNANNKKGGMPKEFVGSQSEPEGFAWNLSSLTVYPTYTYNKDTYDGDPYKGSNYVGFLSLRPNTADVIGTDAEVQAQTGGLDANGYGTHANSYLQWYYKAHNLAINEYSLVGANTSYDPIDKSVHMKIPMYTRNKEMVPKSDFTGNNPFNAYYRYAKVRFTLWQKSGSGDRQIEFKNEDGEWETERMATIYQVPRIENPKAIYRDAGNANEFEIKLMILPKADATYFETFDSDGPWRAYVECSTESFIELYDRNGNKADTIHGVTDDDIVFKYKPKGVIGDNETRSGVIKVEYNDYNCYHRIFVRQGYHKGVQLGNANWSCYNVYATSRGVTAAGTSPDRNDLAPSDETNVPVALTKSPLSVGSLLKRCQYNYSIREENNIKYGWLKSVTNPATDSLMSTAHITASNIVEVDGRDVKWASIQGFAWANYGASQERYTKHWADTWTAVGFRNNEKFSVPTAENFKSLLANCDFGYGVVYADGASTTQAMINMAFGFTDYNNEGNDDVRGVRACVVYDSSDGRNIIFPLGSDGQIRRACTAPWGDASAPIADPGVGSLTYGNLRQVLTGTANLNRPYTFNLYRDPGGLYWIKTPVTKDGTSDGHLHKPYPDYASWDINYRTLVFNPYEYNSLGGWNDKTHNYVATSIPYSSDALPIKLIYQ